MSTTDESTVVETVTVTIDGVEVAVPKGVLIIRAAELVGMLPTRWQRGPVRLLLRLGRPAGLVGAVTAPPVAAYTAVLLADTATPAWHSAYEELPFVFCGSAAAASGGWAMVTAPVAEAGPARTFAVGGAAVELFMAHRMESSMGLSAETLHTGKAGRLMRASRATPELVTMAINTASAQGWRRAVLAWLNVQLQRAEQAGDTAEAERLRRRIKLATTP